MIVRLPSSHHLAVRSPSLSIIPDPRHATFPKPQTPPPPLLIVPPVISLKTIVVTTTSFDHHINQHTVPSQPCKSCSKCRIRIRGIEFPRHMANDLFPLGDSAPCDSARGVEEAGGRTWFLHVPQPGACKLRSFLHWKLGELFLRVRRHKDCVLQLRDVLSPLFFVLLLRFVRQDKSTMRSTSLLLAASSAVSAYGGGNSSSSPFPPFSGDPFKKYDLSAKGINASFIPYGARLTNLYVYDKNGKSQDVAVGYDEGTRYLEDTETNHTYFGAVVGRYANR